MSSAPDLNRFLAELDTRRERLLQLVEPSGAPDAELLAEMTELSEQLIVADEELRVQQEELDATRRALLNLSAERDELLQHSTRTYVVTDARGVVVQASRAVEQLIRQPAVRSTPRPIATWFEVSDRRTVRAMVTGVISTGEPQHADSMTVRTADGQQLLTDLAVERMPDAADGQVLLRWELIPTKPGDKVLHAVADLQPDLGADRLRALIAELGAVATVLADCRTTAEMSPPILDAALRLIPGAEHVVLDLLHEGLASTGRESDGRDPGSTITVPLVRGPRRLGALTVSAADPGSFDEDAELVAAALADLVSTALDRAVEVSELRAGMTSRQLIGGAVGVLTERHRVTPEAAFALMAQRSQATNVKVREIARIILETGQDLSQISGP